MTAVTPADAPAKFVHRLVDRKAFTRAQVILFLPNVVMLCAFVFCHLYRFQAAHLLHPATIAMTNNYLLTGLAGMYAYGVQWPLLAALLHSSSAAMQANRADIKASSNIGEQAARHSPYETALHNVKLIGPEWVQTLLWIISHLLVAPFTWWNIMVSFTVGPAHLQLCRSVAIGTIRREFDNGVSQYVRSFINRFIPGLLFCMFLFSYGLMTAFSYTALVSNAQGGQLAEIDFSVLPEVTFCAQNINEVSARGCRSAALQPLQSTAGHRTRSSAACKGHPRAARTGTAGCCSRHTPPVCMWVPQSYVAQFCTNAQPIIGWWQPYMRRETCNDGGWADIYRSLYDACEGRFVYDGVAEAVLYGIIASVSSYGVLLGYEVILGIEPDLAHATLANLHKVAGSRILLAAIGSYALVVACIPLEISRMLSAQPGSSSEARTSNTLGSVLSGKQLGTFWVTFLAIPLCMTLVLLMIVFLWRRYSPKKVRRQFLSCAPPGRPRPEHHHTVRARWLKESHLVGRWRFFRPNSSAPGHLLCPLYGRRGPDPSPAGCPLLDSPSRPPSGDGSMSCRQAKRWQRRCDGDVVPHSARPDLAGQARQGPLD